jgi:hypothetical protein
MLLHKMQIELKPHYKTYLTCRLFKFVLFILISGNLVNSHQQHEHKILREKSKLAFFQKAFDNSNNKKNFAIEREKRDLNYLYPNRVQSIDTNQIVLFNIGDIDTFENSSNSYIQKFDQNSINYCNFDPYLLSSKRKANDYLKKERPHFNVNVLIRGDAFNETSQIAGKFFI